MQLGTLLSIAKSKAFAIPAPVAVGFELTHLCNLACAYCDRHRPLPYEMTLSQILDALSGLKRYGMREISLDGGEALAHRHIDTISDWLYHHRIVTRLNTNGILIPRRKRVVARCRKVKISLDGPASIHDLVRGVGAFDRAVVGAMITRELGVEVEFTCVLGRHNVHAVDELMELVNRLGIGVVFQPARDSLFLDRSAANADNQGDYRLTNGELRKALARVEHHKRIGSKVANGWSSLRHFRNFPENTPIPCAAGWINLTMDPEGTLFHCGQVNRDDRSCNVVALGVKAALARLKRRGCDQCWCARVVEENYAWGGRFDMSLPSQERATPPSDSHARKSPRHLDVLQTDRG